MRRRATARGRRRVLGALLSTLWLAPGAAAHDPGQCHVELVAARDGVTGEIRIHNVELAIGLDRREPAAYSRNDWFEAHPEVLRAAVAERVRLAADERRLVPHLEESTYTIVSAQDVETTIRFRADWEAPPRRLRVEFDLVPRKAAFVTYVSFRTALAEEEPAQGVVVPLDRSRPWHEFRVAPVPAAVAEPPATGTTVFLAFFRSGVRHLAIGPDHLAFLFGLVLLGGSVLRLAGIVTSFTLAHSLTLACAALGLARPPASWVEPLIALSVVWIGVDNLLRRRWPATRDRRGVLAFGFGLVHGFGFAGVLADLGVEGSSRVLALAGFNAGVEVGQLAVVLVLVPVLARLRDADGGGSAAVTVGGSLAVSAIGVVWLVERSGWLSVG